MACEETLDSTVGTPQPNAGDTQAATTAPAGVGLEAIRSRKTLRVLTRNNGISYYVLHGETMGFDYELAEQLAEDLGVKLKVIVPPRWGDLLPMLQQGAGDIAAASISVTAERQAKVRFAKPYTLTHMRVVWRKGTPKISEPEDLAGKRVHVRQDSAYYRRLESLSHLLQQVGKPAIDIVLEGEDLETEQILEAVAAGKIPYTLCDLNICRENKAYLPNLVIGPRVSQPQALAWAVHPNAKQLAEAVNDFFDRRRRDNSLQTLLQRYYERPARAAADARAPKIKGRKISKYDGLFRAAAGRTHIDWRLLAALAYQASRFSPKARSPNGGRGLFGMLAATSRKLGVKTLSDAQQSTEAAASYLARLQTQFAGVMNADARMQMTLAAFDCGAGHLTDARMLAAHQRWDPNTWDSIAKALRMLSHAKYAASADHGYVRGAEVTRYVDQVWGRYRAYQHATGERDP